MTQFKTGTTYSTRSIGDANCIITATVTKRTAKTVTTENGKRYRIKVCPYTGVETFMPWGNYSMAPVMKADRAL